MDHSKPLLACIYHDIRSEFPSRNVKLAAYTKVTGKDSIRSDCMYMYPFVI